MSGRALRKRKVNMEVSPDKGNRWKSKKKSSAAVMKNKYKLGRTMLFAAIFKGNRIPTVKLLKWPSNQPTEQKETSKVKMPVDGKKESKPTENPEDSKESKESTDGQKPNDSKDSQGSKDSEEPTDPKETKASKGSKDLKDLKHSGDSKASKDPKILEKKNEVKDNTKEKKGSNIGAKMLNVFTPSDLELEYHKEVKEPEVKEMKKKESDILKEPMQLRKRKDRKEVECKGPKKNKPEKQDGQKEIKQEKIELKEGTNKLNVLTPADLELEYRKEVEEPELQIKKEKTVLTEPMQLRKRKDRQEKECKDKKLTKYEKQDGPKDVKKERDLKDQRDIKERKGGNGKEIKNKELKKSDHHNLRDRNKKNVRINAKEKEIKGPQRKNMKKGTF